MKYCHNVDNSTESVMLTPDDATLVTFQQMEVELSRFQKENNILELKVVEEHKKLKAKEQEMIMERTKVSYDLSVT